MTVPLAPAPAGLAVRPVPYAPSVGKRLRQEQFGVVVEGVQDINKLSDDEFELCVPAPHPSERAGERADPASPPSSSRLLLSLALNSSSFTIR